MTEVPSNTWNAEPGTFRLEETETHVWLASVQVSRPALERLRASLDDKEQARAERFRFRRDRNRFIVARGALRSVLAGYLGIEPRQILFEQGARGKPRLAEGTDGLDLQFNSTASGNWAMVAVTLGREIGVDVERIDQARADPDVAKQFFATREIATLQQLAGEAWVEGFFNCWTRKEAFVKAIGDGLYFPLDAFEVSLTPGQPARLLGVNGSPDAASRWSMATMPVPTGYKSALVVSGPIGKVYRRRWSP